MANSTSAQVGTMRAIVQDRYGSPDRLRLAAIARPTPGDDGVLVRVHAVSVNPLDWHFMRGEPYILRMSAGFRRPANPVRGVDVAGVVEVVGKDVTQFRSGDEVFGQRAGSFAEYVCGEEGNFVLKPARLTFEQAAAVPVAGYTALQGLRDKGQVKAGQRVLVNGASGGVGTFAVQIAKAFGAEVTGVCSTRNVELVRSLGADRAIDYTQQDFTREKRRYDVIFDAAGNRSLSACRRALTPTGTLVVVGTASHGRWIGPMVRPLAAGLSSPFVRQRQVTYIAQYRAADLLTLKGLIEAGKVTPVIDRTYPLSEAAEAIRYLEAGHARGKVVVTV
jgi:NADPH:quinone reductase-like Zn-dependent oxidoreductase